YFQQLLPIFFFSSVFLFLRLHSLQLLLTRPLMLLVVVWKLRAHHLPYNGESIFKKKRFCRIDLTPSKQTMSTTPALSFSTEEEAPFLAISLSL
ncbi:unnamed protein product, partial [Bubo scandiacus]